jgi:hypothetical protein
MPVSEAPIQCAPERQERSFALLSLFFLPVSALMWLDADGHPWELTLALSLALWAMGLGCLVLAPLFARCRADADGLSWRDALGRSHAAPWSAVVAVAELSDGRSVSWATHWPGAEALYERVTLRLDRGAYRSRGDRLDERPVHYGFPRRPRRVLAGVALATFVAVAAAGLYTLAWVVGHLRGDGNFGPTLYALDLLVAIVACPVVYAAHAQWRLRHEHCAEVVAVHPGGLAVTAGPTPFRAAWGDVLAVTPRLVRGVIRLHVVTAAGDVTVPFDPFGGLRRQLWERVPPTVREAWERAENAHRGDVVARLAAGVDRYDERTDGVAPWAFDAAMGWLLVATLGIQLMLRADDEPLAVSPLRIAGVVGVWALAVTVRRRARAALAFAVTTSPDGCEWGGWRGRRFTWGDVAEVTLPAHEDDELALRLTDGSALRCRPANLAGGAELVARLRERACDRGVPLP